MDLNDYALEILVRDRLAERRAEGERRTQARSAAIAARPLRVAVGRVLVRLGRSLQGVETHSIPGAVRG